MGQHTVTYHDLQGGLFKYQAACRCGWRSEKRVSRQQVEDEVMNHHVHIERVKAHLGGRTPSLQSQYDYYRERAEDPKEDETARRLWKQLADELGHRLGRSASRWDQPTLLSE